MGALAGINRGRSARAFSTGLFYRGWVSVMFHGSAGQQSRLCRLLPVPLTPPLPISRFVLAKTTLLTELEILCDLGTHSLKVTS